MINIIASAQAAIDAWAAIVSLLSVPESNVTRIAEQVAPIYLPTYHAFDFGTVKHLTQADIRSGAAAQWQHMRDIGVGTNAQLLYSRVETVSNESADCWMTIYICPPKSSHVACWAYTEPFGFRLMEGIGNGLDGRWEFGVGDREFSSIKQRFPNF
jgi:hypothetical protein